MLAPIAVAAYSYMSLIPIIQPPVMKVLTTRKERLIRMEYAPKPVSKKALIVFPIVVTLVISILAPEAAPLIAALMLGNLLKESGVVERLNQSAQNEIINVSTLFLGLTIGATMTAESFLKLDTLMILGLGLLAFVLDTVAGLLFGKLMAFVTHGKINPLIGACGISAFPMAGRLSAKMAQEEDFENFILMHAMGANTAGQLGSVIGRGGLLLMAGNKPLTIRLQFTEPERNTLRLFNKKRAINRHSNQQMKSKVYKNYLLFSPLVGRFGFSTSRRYPTPRSVLIYCGWRGSSSRACRSQLICTSRERISPR